MSSQKISDFPDYGVPDDDVLLYGLFGTDTDFSIRGGDIRRPAYSPVTATGNFGTPNSFSYIELNSASAIALTLNVAPQVGDVLEIYRVGTGGVTHTVIFTGGTFDGTNETANFADDGDYLRAICIATNRYRVVANTGVTFS